MKIEWANSWLNGPDGQRMAATSDQFLRRFIDISLVIELVLLAIEYAYPTGGVPLVLLIALMSALGARVLMHRSQVIAARCTFILPLAAFLVVAPFLQNGIRTPGIVHMLSAVVMIGWLFGRHAMVAMATVYAISLLAVAGVELDGWAAVKPPTHPLVWTRSWVVAVLFVALLGWHVFGIFETLLRQEAELRKQLSLAHAALCDQLIVSGDELKKVDVLLKQVRADFEKAYPLAMLGAAVPGMAHDLHTPLSNAGLAAGTLRSQLDAFSARVQAGALSRGEVNAFIRMAQEGVKIIDQAHANAGALVGNLKDLSIDRASRRRRQFGVAKLMDEVLVMLTPTLNTLSIDVRKDIDPDLTMDSHPGPLAQVLSNLIQNCVVHGFEGRAHGTLFLHVALDDRDTVRWVIQDDGVGMSETVQCRMFEPYFTTKAGRGGSGVGLSSCQEIVQGILEGQITVASAPGKGSRFTLDLPRVTKADVSGASGEPHDNTGVPAV